MSLFGSIGNTLQDIGATMVAGPMQGPPSPQQYDSQQSMEKMQKAIQKDRDKRKAAIPKPLSAAQRRKMQKAKELEERRRLGQIARKKFEKEKGERRIALRKRYTMLLNV